MNDSVAKYQKFIEYEQEKDPCSLIKSLYPAQAKNFGGNLICGDLFGSSNYPVYKSENWILFIKSPTYCSTFVSHFTANPNKYDEGFPDLDTLLSKWIEYCLENPKLAISYFIFVEAQRRGNNNHSFRILTPPEDLKEELEQVISEDSDCSFTYAKEILKDRFLIGEDAIFQNPKNTIRYLTDVVCKNSYEYAKNKIPEDILEKVQESVYKDPVSSFNYARITGERFEKGELAISQDPESSFNYAKYVLKSRFELGEKSIAKVSDLCLKYATSIIGGKLPKKMHEAMELYSFKK